MRSRLLTLVLPVVALLAIPAGAQAALTVGIAENNPQMFSDPLFTNLHVKQTRVVVSWTTR